MNYYVDDRCDADWWDFALTYYFDCEQRYHDAHK